MSMRTSITPPPPNMKTDVRLFSSLLQEQKFS
jgi:hypothetical protein